MTMRFRLITLLFILAHVAAFGQSRAQKAHEKAVQYYQASDYDRALAENQAALRQDPNHIESWLLRGDIMNLKKDYREAAAAYEKVIALDPAFFPPVYLILANAQFNLEDYAASCANYERYLNMPSAKPAGISEAKRQLDIARFRADAMANPVQVSLVNLGPNVNSEGYDFINYISADGQHLYLTRRFTSGPGNRDEDFYFARKQGDTLWSKTIPLGAPVNTDGDEGAMCLSPDGQWLFFAACDRPDGFGSCDIYVSVREGDGWSQPANLGRNVNTEFWETQPTFSSDGRTLYFVSNRPGGQGGSDIWLTRLQASGVWSKAENLGSTINTTGNEKGPFMHPDGQTLYFSSDTHPGMGKGDIFKASLTDAGQWSAPLNIGYPINTSADESVLIVDHKGEFGYYSSEMEGGFGKQDIYRFRLPQQARPLATTFMKGTVYDSLTRQKLQAEFTLTDLKTGREVIRSYSNRQDGTFLLSLPTNRLYGLSVARQGYLFYSAIVHLQGEHSEDTPQLVDIPLQAIRVGENIVLRNVFYATDSFIILPESYPELNRVVALLNQNPGIRVEISGHTDNTGTAGYNQTLSEQRARSVYAYLTEKGIRADRLTFKGYGQSKPVATNETDEGRALNRRTELKVVE